MLVLIFNNCIVCNSASFTPGGNEKLASQVRNLKLSRKHILLTINVKSYMENTTEEKKNYKNRIEKFDLDQGLKNSKIKR